jgi:hypothetical protein
MLRKRSNVYKLIEKIIEEEIKQNKVTYPKIFRSLFLKKLLYKKKNEIYDIIKKRKIRIFIFFIKFIFTFINTKLKIKGKIKKIKINGIEIIKEKDSIYCESINIKIMDKNKRI